MRFDTTTPPQGTLRDWIDARAERGGTAFVFLQDVLSFEWNVVATISLIIAIRIIVIKFKIGLSGIDNSKERIFTKTE